MLYDEFARVNELDTQINKIHVDLANLYAERASLLGFDNAYKTIAGAAATAPEKTKDIYNYLSQVWKAKGVHLPAYSMVAEQLKQAQRIINHLQDINPKLVDKLSTVAVPPYKILLSLLNMATEKTGCSFNFEEPTLRKKMTKNKNWRFIVVSDPEYKQQVFELDNLPSASNLNYKDFDMRCLGIQEYMAIALQNPLLLADNDWVLLLKDSKKPNYTPCAIRHGSMVTFDIDNTNCLLGTNYLLLAIGV